MAVRRRVASLLALAVLATVIQRPMHPYEMASVLRERGKDRDMKIKWGSLYTVVQNLEKHGLLAVADSSRQGGRPERTIYAITDDGRAELVDWVSELISTPEPEQTRFVAGLSVMAVLPPRRAAELLDERLLALTGQVEARRRQLKGFTMVPRLFLVEAEYDLAMQEAELAWVRSLRDELRAGSFPDLENWQRWHDTGELPTDLVALMEGGTTEE